MRFIIYLLLAGVTLGGIAYGFQWIWRAYFPAPLHHEPLEEREKTFFSLSFLGRTWSGRHFLWVVLLVFVLMVMDRVWVNEPSAPADLTPLQTVPEQSAVSDRYY